MLSFELLARFRKEFSLTGSALYETIVTIAERVNRKVQVLRLHAQATTIRNQIHALHRDIGRRMTELSPPSLLASIAPRSRMLPLEDAICAAADRIKGQRASLQHIESHIRDLKVELAQEELLTIQRDLGARDAFAALQAEKHRMQMTDDHCQSQQQHGGFLMEDEGAHPSDQPSFSDVAD